MSNTVLLSAMTMIALTGITLTALKYRNDDNEHSNVILDLDYDDDTMDSSRINPKFGFYETRNQSTVSKREASDGQYAIDDRNVSMIDGEKREKIKEVHARSDLGRSLQLPATFPSHITNELFALPPDDDARLEQLQAVRVGQERAEAHLQARSHRQHLRVV